ncbi:MAG: tail fiber domain-containing protein, partial [Nitrososphaerota archaeon]
VAIGYEALNTGSYNVAVGAGAMRDNGNDTIHNVAVGFDALRICMRGSNNNVAIGNGSLNVNYGSDNIAINYGSDNIAIGYQALENNYGVVVSKFIDTNYNIAIGTRSMQFNISLNILYNNHNIAIGFESLQNNKNGTQNIAIGSFALQENDGGSGNIAIGYEAMVGIDKGNLEKIKDLDQSSIAIGYQALRDNNYGHSNIALGFRSLYQNYDGHNNVAVGHFTLTENTRGAENVAVGRGALHFNNSGNFNVAVGMDALLYNKSNQNVAIGHSALHDNTDGTNNVAVGYSALYRNTNGTKNVAMGRSAMLHVSGNNNIGIGDQAGINIYDGSDNIVIGSSLGKSGMRNTIMIGHNLTLIPYDNSTYIGNIYQNDVTRNWNLYRRVVVNSDGKLGSITDITSSIKFKENVMSILDNDEITNKLLLLNPVSFNFKNDLQKTKQYGLIAEDVYKVFPEMVTMNQDYETKIEYDNPPNSANDEKPEKIPRDVKIPKGEPYPYSVRYEQLIPLLLSEVIKQINTKNVLVDSVEFLTKKIQTLKDQVNKLTEKINILKNRFSP